eukprot:13364-Heterococcus_DN1.PRE.2
MQQQQQQAQNQSTPTAQSQRPFAKVTLQRSKGRLDAAQDAVHSLERVFVSFLYALGDVCDLAKLDAGSIWDHNSFIALGRAKAGEQMGVDESIDSLALTAWLGHVVEELRAAVVNFRA